MKLRDCKLNLKLQEEIDKRILIRHMYGATPIAIFLFLLLDFHYNFSVYVLTDIIVLTTRILVSKKYHPSLDLFLPLISWTISTSIVFLIHP